jgi:bifunctional non-homologous end joining protein LigD
MPQSNQIEIDGHALKLSNLEKVLYPGSGFTKGKVIDYYIRVSRFLLPHLKNRPLTMKRYPNGVAGGNFYEKDAPKFTPDWVATFPVPRRAGGRPIRYILVNDLATLAWCANLANLELHPFLHRAPDIQRPTSVVFDLDPGEGADVLDCARVAFLLKDLFDSHALETFAKVSGSRGLQVYVPLNTPITYEQTRSLAQSVATLLAREHPDLVIAKMTKSERTKKVFIDWSQNSDFKTTVGVYSLRAKRDTPFVSMPVTWEELRAKKAEALFFSPEAALKRLEKSGDLFAPVLKKKQKLPKALSQPASPSARNSSSNSPTALRG